MENVARGEKARRIAHGYVGWAVGAGLIPFPLVDVGGLVALQVKMLTEIAKVYEVPLERERARTLVMSTVGALAPQGVALAGIPSLLKFVPVLGTLLGVAVMPAAAAASTIALADIFIRRIETFGNVPDHVCVQLTHSQAVPFAAPSPPPAAEAVVDEPAASDLPPEPPFAAATDMPSDDLRDGAIADEDSTGSEPEEPGDATTPPDPEPDTDAERPVRRRPSAARTRRRSPPTETS